MPWGVNFNPFGQGGWFETCKAALVTYSTVERDECGLEDFFCPKIARSLGRPELANDPVWRRDQRLNLHKSGPATARGPRPKWATWAMTLDVSAAHDPDWWTWAWVLTVWAIQAGKFTADPKSRTLQITSLGKPPDSNARVTFAEARENRKEMRTDGKTSLHIAAIVLLEGDTMQRRLRIFMRTAAASRKHHGMKNTMEHGLRTPEGSRRGPWLLGPQNQR